MELNPNTVVASKSNDKIYSTTSVYAATFLGGPLVAGYMLANNFKTFGQRTKAAATWFYTLAILSALILIPDSDKIPNYLIPTVYLGITAFIIRRYQKERILSFQRAGGQVYKGSKPALITIGSLLLTISLLIAHDYLYQTFVNTQEFKIYGKTNNEIFYFKKEILTSQVDQVADLLTKINYFDDVETNNILINKVDSTYEIHVNIQDGFQNNPEAIKQYSLLRQALQTIFPNNKVVVNLCVNRDANNIVKRIK
jgi:hypothetical protein